MEEETAPEALESPTPQGSEVKRTKHKKAKPSQEETTAPTESEPKDDTAENEEVQPKKKHKKHKKHQDADVDVVEEGTPEEDNDESPRRVGPTHGT